MVDLPPSEWSIDYFSVDPEGERFSAHASLKDEGALLQEALK